jgi:hypothetical protein
LTGYAGLYQFAAQRSSFKAGGTESVAKISVSTFIYVLGVYLTALFQ